MAVNPIFRSPFTDLTATLLVHETNKCTPLEMRLMSCYEAYGLDRGADKCRDLAEDFSECCTNFKQVMRVEEMQKERERQYKAGERSKEERYAKTPVLDTY
ncbi:NADH dehydrogenase [ubiquinone] iron-sulfur protein 5 [Bacillus rossius redtenbacheri]|uniref:NADH dehydrogenase [ubiquinone] iron-sulfur protein 5 n=1 Tax=Bacillus rossius redtenbacheri TaxID=93214 RepID=UPI002FDDFBEF